MTLPVQSGLGCPTLARMSAHPAERPPVLRLVFASAAIAVFATLLVCLPSAPGPLGLAGLLLGLGTVASAGVALLVAWPQALVWLVPALVPSPMFLLTFAWEIALVVLAAFLVLHGRRTRAAWLTRLTAVEAVVLLWTCWALCSGFWSEDLRWYAIGARRVLMGLCAVWVATRLPMVASRRVFDLGLIAGASTLAMSAIVRSLTTGLSQQEALLRRPEVTNLGWGTANYIAALLLLCSPSLLGLALRGASLERWLARIAFALVVLVQLIVASRAASALFFIATLIQLLLATRRHRVWIGVGFAATVAGVLLSPLGVGLQSRVGSIRELGSLAIRAFYFREGWRRLVDHLPWGLGLWQGFGHADKLQGVDPHNFWLLIGGDLGLPGMVLWTAVMVTLARQWWRTGRDPHHRDQAHTMLVTLVIANLNTLVEPTFQGAHYLMLFFWIMAGTLAYARQDSVPVPAGELAVPLPERRQAPAASSA